jgi:hypothetical protein
MDPISIAAASAGMVISCGKITRCIYTFLGKAQNVDTTIQALAIEVDALSRVLGSVSSNFYDPSLSVITFRSQTGHEAEYWQNVMRSIDDCKETLAILEQIASTLDKSGSGFFLRIKKQIKMDLKSGEIESLRQKISAYRQALSLSLQLITM